MWYMYMYLQSSVVKSNEGGGGGTTHYYRRDASSTTIWKHCSSIVEYIRAKSGREGGGVLTKSGLPAWFCSLHKRNIYVPYALGRCFQSVSASEDGFQLQKLKKGI